MQKGARDDDRGKHTDQNTDCKGQRKALDDAGAESAAKPKQDRAGDQRGKVRVPNRRPGTRPAEIDGLPQFFTAAQLLFQPFEDQDICIHRHANAQNKTGDTWQG